MAPTTYYFTTISLFTAQILAAVMIDDLTLIFGFIAAITESLVNFVLPGVFYIASCKVVNVKP